MRGIGVKANGPVTKGLAELNHHMRNGQKQARDGVAGDGQGLSEEDKSRINEDAENVNGECIELVEAQAVLQRQQQQVQGPVVQWEQFLPLRSLKVLLVEKNDSTRHAVSELLEDCSYEVTAVANGLEAWKILEDLTNHIDLVLTEVFMPCLSGVALLSKIKSHNNCKNIPVIMMSSNDSMGIVFECLSKGAVDFLVKPIRKNELKNLWQHVWRKCHSSSGSVSGSDIKTQKSMKSKGIEGSDNNTGSINEKDNVSVDLNFKDGSDKGSGTQSSWSKRVVEVDRPQQMSPWDQLADPPDSTCAQVIHSSPEAFSSNWVPRSATRECHTEEDELDCVAMGKDLEIGVPRNPDLQLKYQSKIVLKSAVGTTKDNFFNSHSKKGDKKLEKERLELNSETANGKPRIETADLMGGIANGSNPQMKSVANAVPNNLSKTTNIDLTANYISEELPSLELSLKRQRDVGDSRSSAQEQNVLRHSELSAFSRYNTSNANQVPTGNIGNCSPLYNSSEAAKTESMHNLQSKSNGTPNQRSNGSSNNYDMGSTTNNVFTRPEALFSDKPIPKSTVNIHPSSAYQLVQHDPTSSLQPDIPDNADTVKQKVQVQHHYHHYHHHHHHVHNMKQQQHPTNHDDLSLNNMVASASHRGPSDVLTGPVEGNAANYSLNGSINRSNGENGSCGQNGSSTAAIDEGTNMASDNGVAGKCGADDGSGSRSRSGVDQNRLAQREAALNKFRQKRKDRCFDKKVRYQSRKKLAEQRPRVRGQFVRQSVIENKNKDTDR